MTDRPDTLAHARAAFELWCQDASDENAQAFMVMEAAALLEALEREDPRDYDGKLHAQQAALSKLQRKYDTVKGDLRVSNERERELEAALHELFVGVEPCGCEACEKTRALLGLCAEQREASGVVVYCELSGGHDGPHKGRRAPGETFSWANSE